MTPAASSSAPVGLGSSAAAERLRTDGPNALPVARAPSAWRQLGAQLFHFFAIMLWIAGALAIVAGMPELGFAIFLVIVVNGLFAFAQERRAERATHKLRLLLPRRAAVLRDGQWLELDASELVVGDLLRLVAGDRISADIELVFGRGLQVDASMLTGESVPAGVGPGESAAAGSFVVEGEALARVTATGSRTRLARIAELTERERPRTPLALELNRLVRWIAVAALGVGAGFFAVGAVIGLPLQHGFLLAIGVAVALVPEGLLPTVTLSLALGARRMARRGALVRRLDAVETLGATTFICTDKTGTLTSNQMNAVEVWTPGGIARIRGTGYEPVAALEMDDAVRPLLERLALVAVRCSGGRAILRDGRWVSRGDPMEAALHVLSLRLGQDIATDELTRPLLTTFPFDPRRRRTSAVVGNVAYVKGAPDAVLPLCVGADPGAEAAATHMADRGLRVIAVAMRRLSADTSVESATELEQALELVGLVGLFDPPRPEVRHALATCQRAGMRVAMVTGDHPSTARAIAREVGLETNLVLTGDEFPPDDAVLGALLDRDGVIACRVSPEQKLRVALVLQARGHIVAMTGDGVNDGPVLRQADVGIAMGESGTDVAREAADLVLLNDQFETIVYAIEQGRGTFANLRRFLTYHLTDNVAELTPFALWALSGGRFPLALGVLQILCLDLLTDQLPALALGTERPYASALDRPPHRRRLIDAPLLLRAFCLLGPLESAVEIGAFITVFLALGFRPGVTPVSPSALATASGTAFFAIVAGQTGAALACRSASRAAWRVWPANKALFGALAVSWVIAILLLYLPAAARFLGHAPPSPLGFALALLAFPLVLVGDALQKAVLRAAKTRRLGA